MVSIKNTVLSWNCLKREHLEFRNFLNFEWRKFSFHNIIKVDNMKLRFVTFFYVMKQLKEVGSFFQVYRKFIEIIAKGWLFNYLLFSKLFSIFFWLSFILHQIEFKVLTGVCILRLNWKKFYLLFPLNEKSRMKQNLHNFNQFC